MFRDIEMIFYLFCCDNSVSFADSSFGKGAFVLLRNTVDSFEKGAFNKPLNKSV